MLRHHQGRAARDQGEVRARRAGRDPAGRGRDRDRGPDRQRGDDHDPQPPRLHQAHAGQRVPRPGARRQGGARAWRPASADDEEEDDFVEHLFSAAGARLPDVLHEHRPGLCRAGLRDSRRRRAPRRGGASRTCSTCSPRRTIAAMLRLERGRRGRQRRHLRARTRLRAVRHPQRQGEEDGAQRFPQLPQGRDHRDQARGGQRADRRAADQRQGRGRCWSPARG